MPDGWAIGRNSSIRAFSPKEGGIAKQPSYAGRLTESSTDCVRLRAIWLASRRIPRPVEHREFFRSGLHLIGQAWKRPSAPFVRLKEKTMTYQRGALVGTFLAAVVVMMIANALLALAQRDAGAKMRGDTGNSF